MRTGVRAALKAGIRAIDTASLYRVHLCVRCHCTRATVASAQPQHWHGMQTRNMTAMQNEADIARAMHEAGIDRTDVFITSKVAPFQVLNGITRTLHPHVDCLVVSKKCQSGLIVIIFDDAPMLLHSKARSVPQPQWRTACPSLAASWISC